MMITIVMSKSSQNKKNQTKTDQEVKPPNSLLVPGCRFSFPRRNVEIGGARRKRKVYKCGICGQPGHTSPRCPLGLFKS